MEILKKNDDRTVRWTLAFLLVLAGILVLGSGSAYAAVNSMSASAGGDAVTIRVNSAKDSGTGAVYRFQPNQYPAGDSMSGIVTKNSAGTKVGDYSFGSAQTFSVPRNVNGRDTAYDKYYLMQGSKVIAGPVYPSEIDGASKTLRRPVKSKKGIFLEDYNSLKDAEALGVSYVTFNINVNGLILPNENAAGQAVNNSGRSDAIPFQSQGKTYYFKKSTVSYIDSVVSEACSHGMQVTAIIIATPNSNYNTYPRALNYFCYSVQRVMGFNTSSDLGLGYWTAVMEFLGSRYSNSDSTGSICNYIIGNELSQPCYYWKISKNIDKYHSGRWKGKYIEKKESLNTFMEEYTRALRVANAAVKKYATDPVVCVPVTDHWAKSFDDLSKHGEIFVRNSYTSKSIFDWLAKYENARGNYDWGVGPHCYCRDLTASAVGAVDTGIHTKFPATINGNYKTTPVLSTSNIELIQLYLQQPSLLYKGQVRSVYLTETGVSSHGNTDVERKEQAANIAVLYYKAAMIDCIKCVSYYRLRDNAAETVSNACYGLYDAKGRKKPSYAVYKYIDTPQSFAYSNQYLPYIYHKRGKTVYSVRRGNIKSYKDACHVVDSAYNWNTHWQLSKIAAGIDANSSKFKQKYRYKKVSGKKHKVIDIATGKTIATKKCEYEYAMTTKSATASHNGTAKFTCLHCGSSYTVTVPKIKKVTVAKTYTADGVEIVPDVKVYDAKGRQISIHNYDYTVLKGNCGVYQVKVWMTGTYSYKKTFRVTVVPFATSLKSVKGGKRRMTVTWKRQTVKAAGYQIAYSSSKNFRKAKLIHVGKSSATSKTIKKVPKGKKYVRIRVYGVKPGSSTKYYSSWSKAKTVRVK